MMTAYLNETMHVDWF